MTSSLCLGILFVSVEIPHVVPRLGRKTCLLKNITWKMFMLFRVLGTPPCFFTSSGLVDTCLLLNLQVFNIMPVAKIREH